MAALLNLNLLVYLRLSRFHLICIVNCHDALLALLKLSLFDVLMHKALHCRLVLALVLTSLAMHRLIVVFIGTTD